MQGETKDTVLVQRPVNPVSVHVVFLFPSQYRPFPISFDCRPSLYSQFTNVRSFVDLGPLAIAGMGVYCSPWNLGSSGWIKTFGARLPVFSIDSGAGTISCDSENLLEKREKKWVIVSGAILGRYYIVGQMVKRMLLNPCSCIFHAVYLPVLISDIVNPVQPNSRLC